MDIMQAEYIWLDGAHPTPRLRSKVRFVTGLDDVELDADLVGTNHARLFTWSFDASSTYQAPNTSSDLLLVPVRVVVDPRRPAQARLVLCEVFNLDGTPHSSNFRAPLRRMIESAAGHNPWVGFEQEYTLFRDGRVLGWPPEGTPGELGPFFCGVGAGTVAGREFAEAHAAECVLAGLSIHGINAEDMPGQWEFQIGPRERVASGDALTSCDHLWLARWLLLRLGEQQSIHPSFDPKPVAADWPGSGCHANFSTASMRDKTTARAALDAAITALATAHVEHIAKYGAGIERRLIAQNHASNLRDFTWGVGDRTASVRIPGRVDIDGCGYLEDRRPNANCDPYVVAALLIGTVIVGPNGHAPGGGTTC